MEMVVYSEGRITYTEAWHLSIEERQLFIDVLTTFNKQKNGDDSETNEYL
jgi:hypothetical protein